MEDHASGDTSARRLTRSQVAKHLSVSVATVRRMEGSALHPQLGPNGVRYFELTEVRAVREERLQQPLTRHDDEGEVAARVFELLRRGTGLREIVIAAKVPPRVVRTLYSEWLVPLQEGERRKQDAEEERQMAREEREHEARLRAIRER